MKLRTSRTRTEAILWLGLFGCLLLLSSCAGEATYEAGDSEPATNLASEANPTAQGDEAVNVASLDRKIIYEAKVELIVTDFSHTEQALPKLVKKHGGYLAQVSIDQTSGEHRFGIWEVRIPVAQFDAFQEAVSKLGIAISRSQTAQDVTEEFVDLEARIANKKRLEARMIELLEDNNGKLTAIIEVEHELARVRGEVEQMQGRLRYLSNRTDLTTIEIQAREQRDYVPPEAPSFLSRTFQAWKESLLLLRSFAENLAVVLVFLFPWFITLLFVCIPVLWLVHRNKKNQ